MTRREVSVQIVCGVEKLLNIVFKRNCKIDSISYPIINLFPSCVSLSRVLNVDKFKVVWSRRLDLWLSRLPCRGDLHCRNLSFSSTTVMATYHLCHHHPHRHHYHYCHSFFSATTLSTMMMTAIVTCITPNVSLLVSCK